METLIVFIIIFGVIVFVHEFGHFYMAKHSGVLVREFSIGMGPKLVAWRRNETTYTLRILPLGGYVRMAGIVDEQDESLQPGTAVTLILNDQAQVTRINTSHKVTLTDGIPFEIGQVDLEDRLEISGYADGDDSVTKTYQVDHDATIIESTGTEVQIAPRDVQFQSASIPHRLLINAAGIFNNMVLGIVAFIVMAFLAGGIPLNTTELGQIQAHSVAAKAGLKAGDQIVAINDHKMSTFTEMATTINRYPGKQITLQVQRGTKKRQLHVTPAVTKSNGKKVGLLGVASARDNSLAGKLKYGFTQPWYIVSQTFKVIGGMFVHGFNINDFGGPVAMYAMTSQAAHSGVPTVINLMAYLSVSVGIMNLLPIPALDGGKIILNIVEAIRRKPLSPEKEGLITMVGFGLMLLLMILVTWNDIQRFFIR
ncbi:RIP metalloprotease RseP [Loigolactobacillus bifermentans]|uniref:Zinc metalloprotease n=1 Tax=Loigolactobacillus bifermentans DSM 20003 TaxID=1423726 RepID=A0A0R1GJB6_9LACO|nr:RIP metalloprotease RseP [Loigolactobacillus bifermentans]KRK34173.1 membrane-associated zinc metalloprotease [Loigolactobacillus bifermentans DSM 20003]QGG59290.1 RIP metalloprotease RseP [Loigolactobacillus bifermentans]